MCRATPTALLFVLLAQAGAALAGETQGQSPAELATDPAKYRFGKGEVCPFCSLTPQFPQGRSGLHWHGHWKAVGNREYVIVPALLATTLTIALAAPTPRRPSWTGPILFDGAVRNALRLGSPSARQTAASVSDAIFLWEVLHPTLFDPLVAAWWARESPRVAWQMFIINAQSYALTIFVNDLTKRISRRARPWATNDGCDETPDDPRCQAIERYRSFYSGHAAVTATGAGLICAHHTQLELYQNPVLDVGTCLLAIAGTGVTGALRISSDNHWASDVLLGHLMGFASGYLLPTLVYYREFRARPHQHPDDSDAPVMAVLPLVRPDALGLSVVGAF